MLLTQAETEELGRRILALSSAQGCAILLEGHESDNFRFASRGGATNGTTTGARLSVTSSFGQRQGRATTNALDNVALRDVVVRSEAAARSARDNLEVMPPLGPQNYGASAAYFEATAALRGGALAGLLEPAVLSAKRAGLDLAAFVQARRSWRSEEHTSELQSQSNLVCRLLLEKKKHKLKVICEVTKEAREITIP